MKRSGLPPTPRERDVDEQTMDDMLREFTLPIEDQRNYEHSPTRVNKKDSKILHLPSKPVNSLSPVRNPQGFRRAGQRRQNIPVYEKSIKMGAQAFPETDYAPTEMQDQEVLIFPNVEMDLFQELQSELPRSDIARQSRSRQTMAVPRNKFDMEANVARSPLRREKAFAAGPNIKGLSIEQILDPSHRAVGQMAVGGGYEVTFRIQYETNPGESLCIIGSSPELGSWKDFSKARLKWTEGHVWVLDGHSI